MNTNISQALFFPDSNGTICFSIGAGRNGVY
jgi:hypothetical protein